jgi:hypothetical protein
LDRALRYAAATVTIEAPHGDDVWHVVSGEQPRLEVSRSGRYALSVDGLREYASDHDLEAVSAFGGDAVAGYKGERSIAFRNVSERRALSIGREFCQEAIFRVSPATQDVLFVGKGLITSSHEQLQERRRALSLDLQTLLSERFGRPFSLPTRVREIRGWHQVGSPDSFSGVGDLQSARQILRTINDGREEYEPLSVVVNPQNGSVLSREVPTKKSIDTGGDAPLVNARIHLDNCAFSDVVRGEAGPGRRIYVWKPKHPYDGCPPEKTSIYVGETAHTAEDRIQQHLNGTKSSKWVRNRPEGELLRSLMPDMTLPTLATSTAFEEWYGLYLARCGYFVKGGH